MDLADRAQMDEARAQRMQEHLQLREPTIQISPCTHCEDCGLELSVARLKAMPTARRCVPCATLFESLQARGLA